MTPRIVPRLTTRSMSRTTVRSSNARETPADEDDVVRAGGASGRGTGVRRGGALVGAVAVGGRAVDSPLGVGTRRDARRSWSAAPVRAGPGRWGSGRTPGGGVSVAVIQSARAAGPSALRRRDDRRGSLQDGCDPAAARATCRDTSGERHPPARDRLADDRPRACAIPPTGTRASRRRRSGRGFTYRDPNGRPIRDEETLERIRALAIPPAWTDVWICPCAERPPPGDRPRRPRPQAVPLPRPLPAPTRRREVRAAHRLRQGAAGDPQARRARPGPSRDVAREGPRGRRPAARADAHPGRQRRVRPAQPLVRADDAAQPPRDGPRRRRSASGSAASPASSTRSACATAASRPSSAAARTCPARSCSSTSTRTARSSTSAPTT